VIGDALAALADPTRRQIFELVAEQPSPVGQLAERLPVSRPAVSQHLKVLRLAGLVNAQQVGTHHVYRVEPAGLEGVRAYFDSFWTRLGMTTRSGPTALARSGPTRDVFTLAPDMARPSGHRVGVVPR